MHSEIVCLCNNQNKTIIPKLIEHSKPISNSNLLQNLLSPSQLNLSNNLTNQFKGMIKIKAIIIMAQFMIEFEDLTINHHHKS